MALRIYNTLTRKKEELKPINKNLVGIYTCGPTVWNYPHIGNYRAYVSQDILRRYLKYKGYKVKQVMNITDVDDKTIKGSQAENISLRKFTGRYEKIFREELAKLNIENVEFYPRATEHIKEMADMIERLIDKGYAYESLDGIYYKISKFKEYGKLSGLDKKQLKAGASGRIKKDEYDKENVQDFALWKFWTEEDRDVFWETEIGKGRPGWHIECSAMSIKYLGDTFDIHAGGIDLIFPHHENEIAQSEAATGKKFVNYWLHNEHLLVDGKKMSKSLGNFYTFHDLIEMGYDPKAIRYLLLSVHYRQKLNFTFEALKAAKNTVDKLIDFMERLAEIKNVKSDININRLINKVKKEFENAMDDDLNISSALANIFEFITEVNKLIAEDKLSRNDAKKVNDTMLNFDKILGILEYKKEKLSKELLDLIKEREVARKSGNYKKADEIRELLKSKGIVLEDTNQGMRWKKI